MGWLVGWFYIMLILLRLFNVEYNLFIYLFYFCLQLFSFQVPIIIILCKQRVTILNIKSLHTLGLVVRVFTKGPGDPSSIPGRVILKTLKMVLDTSLLNSIIRYVSRVKRSNPRNGVTPSSTPR